MTQKKYEERMSYPAQLFLRNSYTFFTISGTVALRSQHFKTGELQTCSYKYSLSVETRGPWATSLT